MYPLMLKNNFLLIKIVKRRRKVTAKATTIIIKITRTTIGEKTTTRTIIIFVNKTLAYVNQDCFIFSGAQGAANVVIDGDNNTHNNLMNENEGIDYIKITFARILIAFELTRINSRLDISRARVIREGTHITKINENLINVNIIS